MQARQPRKLPFPYSHMNKNRNSESRTRSTNGLRPWPLSVSSIYWPTRLTTCMRPGRKVNKKRHQAREHKREVYNGLSTQRSPAHHQWVSKGKGMQRQQRKARLTMRSKLHDIQEGQEAKCPMASGLSVKGGTAEPSNKAALIQQMLHGSFPNMVPHRFVLKNHYIVCETCSIRLLKHSSQGKFKDLTSQPCWHGAWTPCTELITCGEKEEKHGAANAKHMPWSTVK